MQTFHNLVSRPVHEWASLLHFSLWMEAPICAAARGTGPSWPGWTASAWTGKTEQGLDLWSAHRDCAAAEQRTVRGKNNCHLFVEQFIQLDRNDS